MENLLRGFQENKAFRISILLVLILVIIAVSAPLIAPYDPLDAIMKDANMEPVSYTHLFHQAVRQAEQDQKLLENAPSDSSYLQHGSESIAVKHYYTKGVFTIQSNRHRNAKYPPVFYYNEVRPYDPSANFVEKQMGSDPRRLGNMNLITLEEKHASDGTNDGWTIQFPYNHKGIRNVQIEIGKDLSLIHIS